MTAFATPAWYRHFYLLAALRLRLAMNAASSAGWAMRVFVFSLACAPAVPAFFFTSALFRVPAIAESPVWPFFILNLLGFVTSAVWCIWPLLNAGVDEPSEVSRYRAFPISPVRLLVVSGAASLFEPRALVFAAPLAGATWAFSTQHAISIPAAFVLLMLALALNAALSRVGIYAALNVLRSPRNAELLGGGFVAFLLAASFIPPVDTRWLTQVGRAGLNALSPRVLENAALALGRVPSGYLGEGLRHLALHHTVGVGAYAIGLVSWTFLASTVAYRLLLRHYRSLGAGVARATVPAARRNPFQGSTSLFVTLASREALELWNNPRARLLVAVPFVLGILLKLLSARDLAAFVAGDTADAWLMGGLALYGALVLASHFGQNAFGYEGWGFARFLTAPLPLAVVLRVKNIVHATAALTLAGTVVGFYKVYFGAGSWVDAGVTLLGSVTMLAGLLAVGNVLSVLFPTRFDATLQRKDRPPFIASLLGVAAASAAVSPFITTLASAGHAGLALRHVAALVLPTLFALALYALSFPLVARILVRRREAILHALTRH
ncbi:MAG: hypothetical protein ACKVPX_10610 [Myxococcaceae bacterium]